MFSYVMLGVNDLPKAQQFYDAFFGVLGVSPGLAHGERCFYVGEHGTFAITVDPQPRPTVGATGFGTVSPEDVDAAYAAALAAGGRACDDAPSWHDGGPDGRIYLGSLLDPSGNKICVLHQPQDVAEPVAVQAAAQPA